MDEFIYCSAGLAWIVFIPIMFISGTNSIRHRHFIYDQKKWSFPKLKNYRYRIIELKGWKAVIGGIFMILGGILSLIGFGLGIIFGNLFDPFSMFFLVIGSFLWVIPLQILGKVSYFQ